MSGRAAAWATALLAPLCAGLGAVVVFELTGGLPIAPQVTAAPPLSPELDWSHEPTVFEPPAREEVDIIAARPLFSPSRRPFVATEADEAPPEAPESLPPLELIGVLLTDQQRAALIRPLDGSAASWVREEESVAGWRLDRIERSRVHLSADDRIETVELRADTAVPPEARPKRRKARDEDRREARRGDTERAPDSEAGATEAEADEAELEADEIEADEVEDESPD